MKFIVFIGFSLLASQVAQSDEAAMQAFCAANPQNCAAFNAGVGEQVFIDPGPVPTLNLATSGSTSTKTASFQQLNRLLANATSECIGAFQKVRSECTMGIGSVGGSIATVLQLGAGAAAMGAAGSCNGAKISGGVNLAGDALMGTMCYMAKTSCDSACNAPNDDGVSQAPIASECDGAFQQFAMQAGAQAGIAGLTMMRGGNCDNQLTAANPSLTNPPGYTAPNFNEPSNSGVKPLPANPPQQPQGGDQGNNGAGSGLPTTAYPGGAPNPTGGKGDGNTPNNPALGLAGGGGGGGGWPTGGGGGGWPGGKNDQGIDLSALLPGGKGDPARNPASVNNEVTGAYDLTNFQKVTRMMNKKRPVLKNGEGA